MSFASKGDVANFCRGSGTSRHKGISGKVKFYICDKCNNWHITSSTKKQQRSIRKKLKGIGIRSGQVWENQHGQTIEVIEPPTNFNGLRQWLMDFRLVNNKRIK